jgi:hypothetical protein
MISKKLQKYETCRNFYGTLPIEIINRLENAIQTPSIKLWDDIYGLIVGRDGWATMWQCVIAVDPKFPQSAKPVIGPGKWDMAPHSFTLRRALKYAQTL